MSDDGREPRLPVAGETEVDECTALQRRLNARRLECSQLRAALAKATAEKATAHQAGLAGINAAKSEMAQLRAELVAVRRWKDEHLGEKSAAPLKPESIEASEDDEDRKTKLKAVQMEVRALRHEYSRCKHQVEMAEAKCPWQEEEIVRLKAELTHTLDIFSSTQHAVKHHEVEREFRQREATPPVVDIETGSREVPLLGGGHGCVEAKAERVVREGIETKNLRLSGKAKRLSGVVAAQQLLIQRLEKQVLNEEHKVGQKDEQLYQESGHLSQLKVLTRKRSDIHIAKMMGVAAVQPGRGYKASSGNGSVSFDMGSLASLAQLPPI